MHVWGSADTILQSEARRRKATDQLTQKLSLNINGVIPVPSKKCCCFHDEPPVHDFHRTEQPRVAADGGQAECGSCSRMRKRAAVMMSQKTSSAQATRVRPAACLSLCLHAEALQLLGSFLKATWWFFVNHFSFVEPQQVRHSATSVQLFWHNILF